MNKTEIDTKFEIAEILVKHLDCDISKVLSPLYDYLQKQLILSGVVKSLPTKEEINLAANEFSDINGIICEDEYWVIAKNDGFKEGADFVINKLK